MTRYHGLLKKQPRTKDHTFEQIYAALDGMGASIKKAEDGPLAHIAFEFKDKLPSELVARFQVVGPIQPRSIPKPPTTAFLGGLSRRLGKDITVSMKQSLPKIGMDKVWADPEWDGGSTLILGINDTGIDDYYSTLYFDNRIIEHHKEPWIIGNYKHYHARNVAAIFARNNKNGYRGICDKARIYDGQSLNEEGYGDSASVVGEFNWMGSRNPLPDAISCSLGGPHDPVEDEAVRRLWEMGIVVCCATGNSGGFPPPCDGSLNCPADAPEAICVGATSGGHEEPNDPIEYFQAWSSRIPDWEGKIQKHYVVAPGLQILVDDGESPHSGTSVGQPHALGTIGVIIFFLKRYHPEFNQVQRAIAARSILEKSCKDLGYASSGHYTPEEAYCIQGHGRVQADVAKDMAKKGAEPEPSKIDKVELYVDSEKVDEVTTPSDTDTFSFSKVLDPGDHLWKGKAYSGDLTPVDTETFRIRVVKATPVKKIVASIKGPSDNTEVSEGTKIPFQVLAKVVEGT